MARTKSTAKRHSIVSYTLLLLVVLADLLQSSSSALHSEASKDRWSLDSRRRGLSGLRGNPKRQQIIPNCGEMGSRSQCSQDPKCRWCKSEALDDMCFSKAEAWRLPQQVFVCD
uniref:Uncharacterized protein n=1 Tax=Rhizophora mucronata TaxID=61149 RepID=A0A2P2MZA0_RHIMU